MVGVALVRQELVVSDSLARQEMGPTVVSASFLADLTLNCIKVLIALKALKALKAFKALEAFGAFWGLGGLQGLWGL